MKTRYLLPILLLTVTATARGSVLSPLEAISRLDTGSSAKHLKAVSKTGTSEPVPAYMLTDAHCQPTIYVFETSREGGYLVVSADSDAKPLLGYSDTDKFDPTGIPPQLKYWLEEYGRQIEYMRDNDYPDYREAPSALSGVMTAVGPLVESKWNQGEPYNKYCFTIASDGSETQSVTGCVATAMAQIMYYFKYPEIGKGEISYTHGDSGTYSMDFASQPFDWEKMLDTYYPGTYTVEQGDAVAYLMKACGYSVKMDYGKGESGANGAAIAGALIEYFGYDEGITVQTRKFWTYDDWADMIYRNLSEIGPVVYNGSALDGGHSFICDGYDGNGYFHFNWGWGGMADGYYLLDALNPDEYGIGGAAGGYNLGQQIILSVSPKPESLFERRLLQFGNAEGKIDGAKLSISLTDSDNPGIQYINPEDISVTFGLIMTNQADSGATPRYFESEHKDLAARQGSFFHWDEVGTAVDLESTDMTEGDTYDFTLATLITAGDVSEWSALVANPGCYNYVSVTKTADGYQLVNHTPADIEVSGFKVVSDPVYQNMPVKFSATFTNSSSSQLTRNYSAEFFDSEGTKCFTTENFGITVDADSSINREWTSVEWYKENGATDIKEAGTYTLRLYDNWNGKYVDGVILSVTVDPQPEKSRVDAVLTVQGAEKEGDVYVLSSKDFEASITISVREGYFSSPVNLDIEMTMADGGYYSLQSKRFETIPTLSEGESQILTIGMDFTDAESNKDYRLQAWSDGSELGEPVAIRFNLPTGISEVMPDSTGRYRVYNLCGIKILDTDDISETACLPAGIYIINGKKLLLRND